jgi:hypothetical protein
MQDGPDLQLAQRHVVPHRIHPERVVRRPREHIDHPVRKRDLRVDHLRRHPHERVHHAPEHIARRPHRQRAVSRRQREHPPAEREPLGPTVAHDHQVAQPPVARRVALAEHQHPVVRVRNACDPVHGPRRIGLRELTDRREPAILDPIRGHPQQVPVVEHLVADLEVPDRSALPAAGPRALLVRVQEPALRGPRLSLPPPDRLQA